MNLSSRLTAIEAKAGTKTGPIVLVGLGEERPTNLPPGAIVLIETEEG